MNIKAGLQLAKLAQGPKGHVGHVASNRFPPALCVLLQSYCELYVCIKRGFRRVLLRAMRDVPAVGRAIALTLLILVSVYC
jgi:hypothetical protein